MTKTGAVAGLISSLATASLSQSVVYADGPFNFSPFSSSSATSAGAAAYPSPPVNVPQAATDESRGGVERKSVKNDKPRTSSTGFDHVALERGAAALEQISKSRNAKEIFEILKKQEETKQIENTLKTAEYKAMEAQHELERQRALSEAREKHAQKQAEIKRQVLQYGDDLARSRQRFENELIRNRNREIVDLQEQAAAKVEQIKRDTEEALERAQQKTEEEKAKMEQETYRIKAKADAEAKALEKKMTEDIRRQELLTTANAEREKWIAAINTTFDHIGGGLKAILTDRNKLIVAVGGTTALAAGVYTSRRHHVVGLRSRCSMYQRYYCNLKLLAMTEREGRGRGDSYFRSMNSEPHPIIQSSSLQHWFKNWQEKRKYKLTASTFASAIGFWHRRRTQLWLEKIGAVEPFAGNLATCWNNIKEEEAIERYKLITGNSVFVPEFQVYGENKFENWLAASPDGVVDYHVYGLPSGGLLEVKCPFFGGDMKKASPWYRIPLYHIPQAQGLMEIMDRDWMDFYVWTPKGSSLFRVYRDLDYWDAMKVALSDFWLDNVEPARAVYKRRLIKEPLYELRAYRPNSRHELCGYIVQQSKHNVDSSKLLVREINGIVQMDSSPG